MLYLTHCFSEHPFEFGLFVALPAGGHCNNSRISLSDVISLCGPEMQEIEHLQHLVERSKLALIKEFEQWWQTQVEL